MLFSARCRGDSCCVHGLCERVHKTRRPIQSPTALAVAFIPSGTRSLIWRADRYARGLPPLPGYHGASGFRGGSVARSARARAKSSGSAPLGFPQWGQSASASVTLTSMLTRLNARVQCWQLVTMQPFMVGPREMIEPLEGKPVIGRGRCR